MKRTVLPSLVATGMILLTTLGGGCATGHTPPSPQIVRHYQPVPTFPLHCPFHAVTALPSEIATAKPENLAGQMLTAIIAPNGVVPQTNAVKKLSTLGYGL